MKLFKLIITFFLVSLLNSCTTDGLNISNDKEIKIVQRGSKVITGSQGDVELIINDITNGSTEIKIKGIDTDKVYYQKYLREGDYGLFQYDKYFYRVKINSFEEHIFHDDYAFITFRSVSEEKGKQEAQTISKKKEIPITPNEIRAILNKIKESKLTFIRNNKVLTHTNMHYHLENKYMINNRDIKTKTDFINKVVSNSSLTGEMYKVITNNNDTINIVKWLNL